MRIGVIAEGQLGGSLFRDYIERERRTRHPMEAVSVQRNSARLGEYHYHRLCDIHSVQGLILDRVIDLTGCDEDVRTYILLALQCSEAA